LKEMAAVEAKDGNVLLLGTSTILQRDVLFHTGQLCLSS
jgi:hypothetical protein